MLSILDKLAEVEYKLKHLPGRHPQERHAGARSGRAVEVEHFRGAGREGRKGYGAVVDGIRIIGHRDSDPEEAKRRIERVMDALDSLPKERVEGLERVDMAGGGFPPGSMSYVGDPGWDEIWVNDAGRAKNSSDFKRAIAHEIGHRVQLKAEPQTFKAFKRSGNAKHFSGLMNATGSGKYIKNYPKSKHAGEAFAESYAWYHTRPKQLQSQFPELYDFWSSR